MRRPPTAFHPLTMILLALPACTGLVAGPETRTSAVVPVSRDSAWARARRGFAAEVMTIELVDSTRGLLVGRRYPRASAPETALERCQVLVHLALESTGDGSTLGWESQWVAPAVLASGQGAPCETERQELMGRLVQTIAPGQ